MSYYFLPQRYKRDYALFKKMENDLKHTSLDAINATHLSHYIDNHPEVRYSTPHFTAAKIERQLIYKYDWATVHVTLKRSTSTLKINISIQRALPFITTKFAILCLSIESELPYASLRWNL